MWHEDLKRIEKKKITEVEFAFFLLLPVSSLHQNEEYSNSGSILLKLTIIISSFQAEEIVNHGEGDMKYRHITEMTILTVQLIVEFAKSLPGFDKLLREDQITLLKVNIVYETLY